MNGVTRMKTIVLMLSMTMLLASGAAAAPIPWQWLSHMPQNNHLNAVTYGAGQFVAVGDGGAVITSPDGFNWTWRPSGTPLALRAITYGAGLFVALFSE